jgi:hypothetical protein
MFTIPIDYDLLDEDGWQEGGLCDWDVQTLTSTGKEKDRRRIWAYVNDAAEDMV